MPGVVAERMAQLPPKAEPASSNHAEFAICDQTIESTHLRHPDRLSRLVLALALLYIWLVLWGADLIKAGHRAWVDRHDRRDLSLFRIGLDTLHRCFTLERKLPIPSPSLVGAVSVR